MGREGERERGGWGDGRGRWEREMGREGEREMEVHLKSKIA
jgi:hypothetical protein